MESGRIVIGTDIGGSHIHCMAVDLSHKMLMPELSSRKTVNSQASSEEILGTWAAALEECISKAGVSRVGGIGFAMPGPFDYPRGLALFCGVKKYDALCNVDVRDEIRRRINLPGEVPVRFMNDATCFAVGEAWMGAASAFRRTAAITLGTGFGSSFLLDGIPVESGEEVPACGCVYHLPYRESIANDYFSSFWFETEYENRFNLPSPGVRVMTDQAKTDASVRKLFADFGSNLGGFLAPWLLLFRAECITIGGNITRSYDLFGPAFREALAGARCNTELLLSTLGEHAAIAGSARLSDDGYYSRLPFISNK